MLRDLLKGKMRDITPQNRPTCFDSLGGGGSGGVEIVRVTLTGKDSTLTCDKTFDELYDAMGRGALIFIHWGNNTLYFQYEYSDSDADNYLLFCNDMWRFDIKYNNTYSMNMKS